MHDMIKWLSGTPLEMQFILRLLLAVAAGAIVGIEREFRGRPAGLRTHILVALGSAILAMASLELGWLVNGASNDYAVRVDVSRIASGMITGIGFLGAGTIIKTGKLVRGLTTAASLWCIASIGMSFGFGFYRLSFLGSLMTMFTLIVVNRMEKRIAKDWYKTVIVRIKGGGAEVDDLTNRFKTRGWDVQDVDWRKDKVRELIRVDFEVRLNGKMETRQVADLLDGVEYVRAFRIE